MTLTTMGWCAGRPQDHGTGLNEADVARIQHLRYPFTSSVRDFRGNSSPSTSWWSTQTLDATADARTALTVDVALSWTQIQNRPLIPFLNTKPSWVNRIFLLGVHEMHNPDKGYTPQRLLEDFRYMRSQVIEAGSAGRGVFLIPTFIYYRERDPENKGTSGEVKRYLDPLASEGLTDAIGWDCYPCDPTEDKPWAPENYEDPEDYLEMYDEFENQYDGLPGAVFELNHRRVPNDFDGRRRAQWLVGMFQALKSRNALTVNHFHYNEADLIAHDHVAEQDALAALCREASAAWDGYRLGLETVSRNRP